MGCDMVVALNQATVQGNTLFGLNHHDVGPVSQVLCRFAGAQHAPDEVLRLGNLVLPQVRRTNTVLGSQPCGTWGLTHGINEHRVAAGFSCWQSKLPAVDTGLLSTDLTRLTLERSQSARQALDILTDLLGRHGQRGSGQPAPHRTLGAAHGMGSIFLLADPKEAFVVETAGCHWAMLECQQVRAVSDTALIRQDWRRPAPGLAELAIANGWWADDGSKLDVTGSLAAEAAGNPWPLKRWGKATVALEQQHGHIDPFFLRGMLGDHFDFAADAVSAETDGAGQPLQLLTSFVAELPPGKQTLPIAWCAYGPNEYPLFFPILLDGDLPPKFSQHANLAPLFVKLQELLAAPEHEEAVKKTLDDLQARFDQQMEEFLNNSRTLLTQNDATQVPRLAGMLMQNHWEMLEAETRRLPSPGEKTVAVG